LKKGSAEFLILSLVEDRALHGYDIAQLIDVHNRAFRANSSQLARSGKWKDVKDLRGRWVVNERRISA